ncbi:hypothetical protein TKK_0018196 [Trichogramma kaykai]
MQEISFRWCDTESDFSEISIQYTDGSLQCENIVHVWPRSYVQGSVICEAGDKNLCRNILDYRCGVDGVEQWTEDGTLRHPFERDSIRVLIFAGEYVTFGGDVLDELSSKVSNSISIFTLSNAPSMSRKTA